MNPISLFTLILKILQPEFIKVYVVTINHKYEPAIKIKGTWYGFWESPISEFHLMKNIETSELIVYKFFKSEEQAQACVNYLRSSNSCKTIWEERHGD